ncbi:MAG: cation transporter [Actinomycetota bacterium]
MSDHTANALAHGQQSRGDGHGHSHGLVDRSILRSRDGVKTVAISLAILGATAAAQRAIFILSGSVALLADLIHNVGDALTTLVILKITWDSWRAVRRNEPDAPAEPGRQQP